MWNTTFNLEGKTLANQIENLSEHTQRKSKKSAQKCFKQVDCFLLKILIFIKAHLLPQTLVPSNPLAASSASLASSISTNAKPGGLLATQTSLTGPYLAKASSKSYLPYGNSSEARSPPG